MAIEKELSNITVHENASVFGQALNNANEKNNIIDYHLYINVEHASL